ncbi:MAG: serine/threonine protein kinase [Myxococcota bacterium]|nr:serine/threonine protein kinase [Myxococcota bacterium]
MSVHEQPTRIVSRRRVDDDRRTIEVHRARCGACTMQLPDGMSYCGNCGTRVYDRRRAHVGSTLDGLYEIDALIAEGGFASIYLARCLTGGLEVAIKILHEELGHDPTIVERFAREARCLVRLRDTHTVATLDHGTTSDGVPYIVMELLRGETLHERLARVGAFRWREALAIMRAACSSLAEAHAHGIVHRDLKPANLHLGSGIVKVLDFGLAKSAFDERELTRIGQTVGTLPYMSPEQLAGGPCDARSDIFTLGVIGHEMLTGHRPFDDAATGHPEIPDEVERLIERCIERTPAERFATMNELACEIDRILESTSSARAAPAFRFPPRLAAEHAAVPAFVSGSSPAIEVPERKRYLDVALWALWFVVGGAGIGSALAHLI